MADDLRGVLMLDGNVDVHVNLSQSQEMVVDVFGDLGCLRWEPLSS